MSELSDKIYPGVDSFSHIRFAPSGDIAIVAPIRGKKPKAKRDCIFCPENINELAEPSLNGDALSEMKRRGLYVLDNAYPVVATEESTREIDLKFAQGFDGIFYNMNIATGRHLVMIETSNHNLNPFSETPDVSNYYQNLVWGYINMLKLLKSEGYKWGGVGKNRNGMKTFKVPLLAKLLRILFPDYGVIDAGASQWHPHSQALAMNFVPGNFGTESSFYQRL